MLVTLQYMWLQNQTVLKESSMQYKFVKVSMFCCVCYDPLLTSMNGRDKWAWFLTLIEYKEDPPRIIMVHKNEKRITSQVVRPCHVFSHNV